MTIYDLNWQPAAVGGGFIASHRFENGKVARIRRTDTDAGESYHLAVLDRGQHVCCVYKGLDRAAFHARLNTIPYLI